MKAIRMNACWRSVSVVSPGGLKKSFSWRRFFGC